MRADDIALVILGIVVALGALWFAAAAPCELFAVASVADIPARCLPEVGK